MDKRIGRNIFDVQNDRKNNLDNKVRNSFDLFEKSNSNKTNTMYERSVIKSDHCDNLLNQTFFSKGNINILQNALRFKVNEQIGHIIGPQSETELVIIMRAIFFQHAKNLDTNIPEQISELNNIVIQSILPKILSNVKQYQEYLKNKAQIPLPMDRSINVNNKGIKQLRSVTDTF